MFKYKKIAMHIAFVFVILLAQNIFAKWLFENGDWYYKNSDSQYEIEKIIKYENDNYYLDENGKMVKNYVLNNNDDIYYFDKNGKMVKDTFVAVDVRLLNDMKDSDKLYYVYYFQDNGKAFRASDNIKRKTIDGKNYIFDEEGRMLTGFIGLDGELENESDDDYPYKDCLYYATSDGVLQSGWLAYEEGTDDEYNEEKEILYLYFSPSNNKKINAEGADIKEKQINGKKYIFDKTGVMLSKWDEYDIKYQVASISNIRYFGLENDGSMKKNQWVYDIPSKYVDEKYYYDDEKKWFYFGNAGRIITGKEKKIDKKNYIFDNLGIMQTGIVLTVEGKYEDTISLEDTTIDMISKEGMYLSKKHEDDNPVSRVIDISNALDDVKMKYYSKNGDRTDGKIFVDFVDDSAEMMFTKNGAVTGKYKKKYYSNGVLLKAKEDNKLGIVVEDEKFSRMPQMDADNNKSKWPHIYQDENYVYHTANYLVVDKNGKVKKKGIYKDADENYWVVDEHKHLLNIFKMKVKSEKKGDTTVYLYEDDSDKNNYRYFVEYNSYANGDSKKIGDKRFDVPDIIDYDYSSYCVKNDPENQRWNYNYMVVPKDEYILNFTLDSDSYGE